MRQQNFTSNGYGHDDGCTSNICSRTKIPSQLWSRLSDVYKVLNAEPPSSSSDEGTLYHHVRFHKGQRLFLCGEAFKSLFLIKTGFLKNVLIDESGNEQILSFPMKGDLIGFDGFNNHTHSTEAVALSDVDAIILPCKTFALQMNSHPELENLIYQQMSKEVIREQRMIGVIGALPAEARVARFLISLGRQFERIGYSKTNFNLRMTRQEIGSYLGITLETVSRTLSAFQSLGYIAIDMRNVQILEEDTLTHIRRIPPSKQQRKSITHVAATAGVNILH
jgi:CRP/FNR family transcriptional regulator